MTNQQQAHDVEPIKEPMNKVLEAVQEMARSQMLGSLQLTQQLIAALLEQMGHKVIRPANRLQLVAHKRKTPAVEATEK